MGTKPIVSKRATRVNGMEMAAISFLFQTHSKCIHVRVGGSNAWLKPSSPSLANRLLCIVRESGCAMA